MSKPTAEEKRFHLTVMAQGCCVCGGDSLFHHEKQPYPLPRRDHKFGVPLCHEHHTELHVGMGWRLDKFKAKYGMDLYKLAQQIKKDCWNDAG